MTIQSNNILIASASNLQSSDNYIHVRHLATSGDPRQPQLGPQVGIIRSHLPIHEDSDDDNGNTDSTSARMIIYYANCQERRKSVLAKKMAQAERRSVRELASTLANSNNTSGNSKNQVSTGSQSATPSNMPMNNDEYAPVCTSDGGYAPLQCHDIIGYCWCVDDAGKPIRGSSAPEHKKPDCVRVRTAYRMQLETANAMYSLHNIAAQESVTISPIAVSSPTQTQISVSSTQMQKIAPNKNSASNMSVSVSTSATRKQLSKLLLNSNRGNGSDTDDKSTNTTEASITTKIGEQGQTSDCKEARNRALNVTTGVRDEGIWVPECDESRGGELYAEIQCHYSKYCWCVDTKTGIPMRGANLTTDGVRPDCAEARAYAETLQAAESSQSSPFSFPSIIPNGNSFNGGSTDNVATAAYSGNGPCSGERRSNFLRHLINQFQDQLYERLVHNESLSKDLKIDDPRSASKMQVNKWKFTSIDSNGDNRINEREWTRFRSSYRIVSNHQQQIQHENNRSKQTKRSQTPLTILRTQRRCWREFLATCEAPPAATTNSGSQNRTTTTQNQEDFHLISLEQWLECTDTIVRPRSPSNLNSQSSAQANISLSLMAAETRRKGKNPFLPILKDD